MRYNRRTDANHRAIVQALIERLWYVDDWSNVGHGMPDLVVERSGRILWLEVKDGSKKPSEQKLTLAEVRVHDLLKRCGCDVRVITSVEDVASL